MTKSRFSVSVSVPINHVKVYRRAMAPLQDEMNTVSGDIFSLTFIYLTELILITANRETHATSLHMTNSAVVANFEADLCSIPDLLHPKCVCVYTAGKKR